MNSVLLRLLCAKSVEATWAILVEEMARYGFDRLLYGMTRFRTQASLGNPADMLILSNHPDDYVRAFVSERMFVYAPMAVWAVENEGGMPWSYVSRIADTLTKDNFKVLELNKEFDVLAGLTVSFPDPSPRQKAAIGLTAMSGLNQGDVDGIWKDKGEEIEILAHVAHLKLASLPVPAAQQRLSKRQREALEWVSEGKTTQDAATIMGLTPATVEKHLRKAREALEVETTAQAIMKASLQRQFFMFEG
ncbi:Transcriptional activator protein EsaR [Boseongicola aestuarii]|uniref:Transcriptional activator protein EsaR n=1 Tax=Boseongicola aestuarii TaxID=1470561 RepID=A0A238IWH2_9RHOB|nr:Transcriptional activator protein EsaR [Boseongicola aestuarii]